MDPISRDPQEMTADEVDALQACIDFYLEQLRGVSERWPISIHLENVAGGYVVKHNNHTYRPADWVHFNYLHYLRAIGVRWAAERWEARNELVLAALRSAHDDIVVTALQAEE